MDFIFLFLTKIKKKPPKRAYKRKDMKATRIELQTFKYISPCSSPMQIENQVEEENQHCTFQTEHQMQVGSMW